jgi:hypothetical protein
VKVTFLAYRGGVISFEGRDEAAGVLGRFTPRNATPMLAADTLEKLEHDAWAYVGKEPDACLYLTDKDDRLYKIILNQQYHQAAGKAERRLTVAIVLLVFCITCLLTASLGSLGIGALLCFVGVVALYAFIVRMEMFNTIEGAVLCQLLLVMALFLVSAVQKLQSRIAERNAAEAAGINAPAK